MMKKTILSLMLLSSASAFASVIPASTSFSDIQVGSQFHLKSGWALKNGFMYSNGYVYPRDAQVLPWETPCYVWGTSIPDESLLTVTSVTENTVMLAGVSNVNQKLKTKIYCQEGTIASFVQSTGARSGFYTKNHFNYATYRENAVVNGEKLQKLHQLQREQQQEIQQQIQKQQQMQQRQQQRDQQKEQLQQKQILEEIKKREEEVKELFYKEHPEATPLSRMLKPAKKN